MEKENVITYQKFIIMTLMEVYLTSVMYHAYHQTVTSLWISFGIVRFGMFLDGFQKKVFFFNQNGASQSETKGNPV